MKEHIHTSCLMVGFHLEIVYRPVQIRNVRRMFGFELHETIIYLLLELYPALK